MTQNGDTPAPTRRAVLPELHPVSEGAAQESSAPPEIVRLPLRDMPDPGDEEPPRDRSQAILEAAKRIGGLLKHGGHLFALAGSVAAYAHGAGARLQHDADFCVRREDAEAVAETLAEAGLTVRTPPEDWLIKTNCLGQDVDLIFELAHRPVTTAMLARAEQLPVDSVHMPVLAPTDLMRGRIEAFSEHYCDFGSALAIARALREKVDWEAVRRDCGDQPMPAAFFFLLERLNVIEPRKEER
ncbi:nucleotidyltransferase family protein [Streptomyces cupreus]|uniref:Nucleotidyltransferase family protein n=1 Tax=Streptomyces cupreus TaxID=2759956 RepID=A0A7X1MEB4_9ACTN|nr:nucleotidyltransferase family protein [Streptomyces cupreus]MBC2905560.1 nucleotidyltransferase family protein [Streptomyces cupreus]